MSDGMTDNRSQPDDADNWPFGRSRDAGKTRPAKPPADGAGLTPDQKAELANLAAKRDDEIDTSDIPETTDWSGAERGKFYRGGGVAADDAPHGACIFAASYEILAEFLRLPPGVRIVGIRDESWSGSVDIAVRGPGLPACKVGELPPRVRAIATAQAGGKPAVSFETVQTEADMLRAEVARLRKLVEDDGR